LNTTSYSDGPHNLTVIAYDNAGNNKIISVIFYIDNTPPSLDIVSPAGGSWVGTYVFVNVSVSDEHSGVYAVELLVNGSSQGYYYPQNYGIYWNASDYVEDTYNLTVVAYDNVNNTASASIIVHLDKTPPTINVTSPANESCSIISVSVSAEDSGSGVERVTFIIDGNMLFNDTVAPYEYSLDTCSYLDGEHTITVIAYDRAGNSRTASVVFYVDNSPPIVEMIYPTEGDFIKGTVNITVSVDDFGVGVEKILFIVDGTILFNDTNAPYSYVIDTNTYDDGLHNLTILAYDKLGSMSSITITLFIDNTPPTVSIVSPASGSWVETYVYVNVSVSDEHSGVYAVELLVNGSSQGYYYPPDYDIYWNATEYAEGTYNLTVVAYDNANNTAFANVFVHLSKIPLDNMPPTVDAVSPTNKSWVRGVVNISVSVSDSGSGVAYVTFYTAGLPPILLCNDTEEPYEYSWDTKFYAEGIQHLVIYVVDRAGNSKQIILEYYVDKTPPAISTVYCPDTAVEGEDVKISATVSDALSGVSEVILSCYFVEEDVWENITMTAKGNNVYEATIPWELAEGSRTVQFKIIAVDEAGNVVVSQTYSYEIVSEEQPTEEGEQPPPEEEAPPPSPLGASWTLIGGIGAAAVIVIVLIVARRRG